MAFEGQKMLKMSWLKEGEPHSLEVVGSGISVTAFRCTFCVSSPIYKAIDVVSL